LKSGQRVFVLNIFNKLNEMCLQVLYTMWEQFKTAGWLRTPGKKCQRKQRANNYDVFVKTAVWRKVHGFFFKNELPTMDKVLLCVNSDSDLSNFSRSRLIGFQFLEMKQQAVLMDRMIMYCGDRFSQQRSENLFFGWNLAEWRACNF
jgi:hypothetical protein